jgi:DEAD/DEAH box helicase domain-containing protein
MNDPVKIYNYLRDTYARYLNTGLAIKHDTLAAERRALFDEPGTICRPAYVEMVNTYMATNTLREVAKGSTPLVSKDFANFSNCGLFGWPRMKDFPLYRHQERSLQVAHQEGRNLVVTTGTGSGKTECFMLPLVANILEEAKGWEPETRPRAVRALMIYPLNALADDQMVRLRKALNSEAAVDWLDDNRDGNRIYFGRYTGDTPGSGKTSTVKEFNKAYSDLFPNWTRVKEKATSVEFVDGKETYPFFEHEFYLSSLDKERQNAELWHRHQMRATPPDLLITNFSMLNIMLMRRAEETIFTQTRNWLESNPENKFHLIIDELHSYRGTPGTEIAFTIRLLLRRLGLTPTSPQLRILASSASLAGGEKVYKYLGGFFGFTAEEAKERFEVISDEPSTALAQTSDGTYSWPMQPQDAANLDKESVKQVAAKLALALADGPKTFPQLSRQLFDDESQETEDALAALIKQISLLDTPDGQALLKLRTHGFFRSVSELYACTNAKCDEVASEYDYDGRSIGRLYKRPRSLCNCGGRVLNLYLCRFCGEVFWRGYYSSSGDHQWKIYSEPQPSNGVTNTILVYPGILTKASTSLFPEAPDNWNFGTLYSLQAELTQAGTPDAANVTFMLTGEEGGEGMPSTCPYCEVTRQTYSPVSPHRIGAQRVSQVLGSALFRAMRDQVDDSEKTKLIVFSDSRQGAAKLSAGLEHDHYLDTLRQMILKITEDDRHKAVKETKDAIVLFDAYMKRAPDFFQQQTELTRKNGIEFIARFNQFMAESNGDRELFIQRCNKPTNRKVTGYTADLNDKMLAIGTNPGGPLPSLDFKESDNVSLPWYRLYRNWKNEVPDPIKDDQLRKSALQDIERSLTPSVLRSMFAHNRMSMEAMAQGRIRVIHTTSITGASNSREFIDAVIRILAESFRIQGNSSNRDNESGLKTRVWRYARAVLGFRGYNWPGGQNFFIDWLANERIITSTTQVTINGEGLEFIPARDGDSYWKCGRCTTVHLQPSCGVCTNCQAKLPPDQTLTEDIIQDKDNYYLFLAHEGDPFRLHAEELTGQTDKEDKQSRQARFRDVFDEPEYENPAGIDILSVTTTMEAGVDVGGLSAVMMGNVPPQRFNYQQRVGRAGRRGQSVAFALTVARSSSHDQVHYALPVKMITDPPSNPYLDLRRKEIAQRVINKEILCQVYRSSPSIPEPATSDTHGGFGDAIFYRLHRSIIKTFIENNFSLIHKIVQDLLVGTDISNSAKEIAGERQAKIIEEIDEVVANTDRYPQLEIGEKLASAGLFPMFGFPTRVRNLYLSQPQRVGTSFSAVDRTLDYAISAFAPGATIVKDKKVYRSTGLVGYKPGDRGNWQQTDGRGDLHTNFFRCTNTNCGSIYDQPKNETNCRICSAELEQINACTPLGFYPEKIPEDYKGVFEYRAVNTHTALDPGSNLGNRNELGGNLCVSSNRVPIDSQVHLINDNMGQSFPLRPFTVGENNEPTGRYRLSTQEDVDNNLAENYVFTTSRHTGVIALNIKAVNAKLDLNPYKPEVKLAMKSYAYLIRRSICDVMDIETKELTASYRPIVDEADSLAYAQVYFAETLENGAGYCNYLNSDAGTDYATRAFFTNLSPGGALYETLLVEDHLSSCDLSCYDCLREYDNQWEHHELYWRLALDVVRISGDSAYTCSLLDSVHWQGFTAKIALRMAEIGKGSSNEVDGVTCYVQTKNGTYLIVHPLWTDEYIAELLRDVPESHPPVQAKSVIELIGSMEFLL